MLEKSNSVCVCVCVCVCVRVCTTNLISHLNRGQEGWDYTSKGIDSLKLKRTEKVGQNKGRLLDLLHLVGWTSQLFGCEFVLPFKKGEGPQG